jgi:hypothetical protein
VEYGKRIQQLQDADPGFYKYHVQVHAGKGHWMDLQDTVALTWMAAFTRKPHPNKVVWLQDKPRIQSQFHWIALPGGQAAQPGGSAAADPARITAEIKGQEVHVDSANVDSVAVLLNDQLVDLDQPVRFFWKGVEVGKGMVTRTAENLYRSSEARGDREYVFPARVVVSMGRAGVSLRPGIARGGFRLHREPGRYRLSFGGERLTGSAWVAGLSGRIHDRIDFTGREEVLLSSEGLAPGVAIIAMRTGDKIHTRRIMAD